MSKQFLSRLDFITKMEDERTLGVYTENDLLYPITYAEFSFWLLHLNKIEPVLSVYDTLSVADEEGYGVYAIKSSGKVDLDLCSYKMSPDMESYIESIVNGYRYSPIIFVYSFLNFIKVFDLGDTLSLDDLYRRVDNEQG